MAHASKSFVVFTGGEWSEQLHGRTDLAKADSAGRKVRNFVPAQTGRLSRRKGLEFVGAALGECLAGDPIFEIPSWSGLDEAELIEPSIDVYGALGPEELRTSAVPGPIWQVCANIQYCYGPTEEGATMQNIGDRYRTRWVAKLEDGRMYYRRVGTGEDWTPVPNELVPQPNDTFNGIGFCFDANARPCFASAISEEIHLWRWVSDTSNEYVFNGQGPRLFFNGTLQYDHDFLDVTCYFCWNGDLVAAFQRENFLTNYTLFSSEDYYFTRVRVIERGHTSGEAERLYIAATGNSNVYGLFRSGLWPKWPVFETDSAVASVSSVGGVHRRVVFSAGFYEDSAASEIGPLTGTHRSVVVTLPTASDSVASSIGVVTGAHKLVRVTLATESDPLASTIGPLTGVHKFVVIQAGTYNDSATSTTAPLTGVHRHV